MACHCPTCGGCPCDDPVPMTIRQVWHRVKALIRRVEALERAVEDMQP